MAAVRNSSAAPDDEPETEAPSRGDIRRYPVGQPDGSQRNQFILVTHVGDDGKPHGIPVGWEDQAAEFAAGDLI